MVRVIPLLIVISGQESTFASGGNNKAVTNTNFEPISRVKSVLKVRETIYILGLGDGDGDGAPPQRRGLGPRPPTEGEDFVVLKVKSTSRL